MPANLEGLAQKAQAYEACCDRTLPLMITACQWGTPDQVNEWQRVLRRLAAFAGRNIGHGQIGELRAYPALLHLYAGGLGALARKQFGTLASLLLTLIREENTEAAIAVSAIVAAGTYADAFHPKGEKYFVPRSERLFDILRGMLSHQFPLDEDYAEAFDEFEYLVSCLNADAGGAGYLQEDFSGAGGGTVCSRRN